MIKKIITSLQQKIVDNYSELKPWPRLRTLRYLDLLFLTVVAGLLFYLVANIDWVQIQAEKWAGLVLSLPIAGQCFLPFVFGLGLVYLLRWFGCEHQNHKWIDFWKYPSCYISGLFFSASIIGHYHSDFIWLDINNKYGLGTSLFCFFIGIWAEDIIAAFKNNPPSNSVSDKSIVTDLTKLSEEQRVEKILEWVQEEKPSRNLDLFGAQAYADKISQRLNDAANSNSSLTQAIIGPFGVGKSTIIQHTINKTTESDKKWIIVKVDAWGASGSNITSIILKRIISTLSEHFDIAALKSLPEQYLDSLNAAKQPHIMALVAALRDSESAKNKLEKLDNFLATVNRRLLIVIEDVDRHDEAKKHCNALASLLDNLRSLKRTSFILAVGFGAGYDEILKRICLYRDYINPIDKSDATAIIGRFLEITIAKSKIEPINEHYMFLIAENNYIDSISSAITTLIQTPRELKNILRKTQDAWSVLQGEVNLEELFLLNIIRYTDIEYFDKIYSCAKDNHITLFKTQNETDNENTLSIARHLFPTEDFRIINAQSVAIEESYKNYTFLRRCMFERIEEKENQRDQSIIKVLKKIYHNECEREDITDLCLNDFTFNRVLRLNKIGDRNNIVTHTTKILCKFVWDVCNKDRTLFIINEESNIKDKIGKLTHEIKTNITTQQTAVAFSIIKKISSLLIEKSLHLATELMFNLSYMCEKPHITGVHSAFKDEFKNTIHNSKRLYQSIDGIPNSEYLCAYFLCSDNLNDIDDLYIVWFLSLVVGLQESDSFLAFEQLFHIIGKLYDIYESPPEPEKLFREEETKNKILTLLGGRVEDIKLLMQENIEIKDLTNGDRASKIRKIFNLADR